jgi:hypothetical protein
VEQFSPSSLQLDTESGVWYSRFLIYRNMPPASRTLLGAVHRYDEERGASRRVQSVPGSWWQHWKQDNWQGRAEAYDADRRREAEVAEEAARQAILAHGYAKMHRRLEALDKLADKLEALIAQDDRLWQPYVKQIGFGPSAERVDLITFNDALVREYRAALSDIAAELGERVKMSKQDVSGSIELAHRAVFVLPELDEDDRAVQDTPGETA